MSIYKKLLIIQQAVKGLKKDKKSNNYEYVTGNKLLSFIKPLMDDNGLLLKQEVLSIDNERMDYKTGIGTTYEKPKSEILTKVMMKFTWVDCETGEKDENLFGANGQNEWEKGLGSALTYAERYFLLKYFHIATDEDDIDNPDRKPEDKTPTQQVKQPAAQKPQPKQPIKTEQIPINIDKLKNRYDACDTREALTKLWKSLTPIEQKTTTAIAKDAGIRIDVEIQTNKNE